MAATSSRAVNAVPVRKQEFDPRLLFQKLDEYRQKTDAQPYISKEKRATPHEDVPSRYKPRNAASQFCATTKPMKSGGKALNRSASVPQRMKPPSNIDKLYLINPKIVLARRDLGMSESEVVAAMGPCGGQRPDDVDYECRNEVSRDVGAYPSGAATRRGLVRPNDTGAGKPRIVNHALGNVSKFTHKHHERLSLDSKRPQLKSYNRPDWTQASQCGEVAHVLLRQQGEPKASHHHNPPSDAPQSAASDLKLGADKGKRRLEQAHDVAIPGSLIGEAVKQIKRDERKKRRSGIMAFFSRP